MTTPATDLAPAGCVPRVARFAADRRQLDRTSVVVRRRHAIVLSVDQSNAGIFIVVVGGALLALLVLGGRAGRSIARDVWSRIGFFRWILVAIIIVVVLDLSDGLPNQ
ncbi:MULTISPECIES: hypothetical protein [Frankia]|uniref:hypothetical protein n=1 Tax=Frankia TaxID=1854 RepID=UPI001F2113CA|nr:MULTISPECIES: hypothetical protein [Frankia]